MEICISILNPSFSVNVHSRLTHDILCGGATHNARHISIPWFWGLF